MSNHDQSSPGDMCSWPLFYPGQGMGLRFNSDTHQFMVRWMVGYLVDPITKSIMGSQLRGKPICQDAEIDSLRLAQEFSQLARFRLDPTAALATNGFFQCAVAIEK